ncbi:MAG: crotonase/enoyl-CoA hydratase family protein [Alphaproteobacteria bacterium]
MSIRVERDGPVTTLTIDRPHARNALDTASAAELARAFKAFDADDDACVAVLTGAGGAFCAGADLKELADGVDYQAWATHDDGPTAPLVSKPVIAAVAGHACAGGLGLALWCDIRIAEESAVFGVFSRRWGVPMSDGTTVRLPRVIGMGPALDMMITGRPVGAAEARQLGLATRVVPDGTSLAAALELAHQVAGFPQIAMRSDRASVYAQAGRPLAEALARETELSLDAKRREAAGGAARFRAGAGRHGARDS